RARRVFWLFRALFEAFVFRARRAFWLFRALFEVFVFRARRVFWLFRALSEAAASRALPACGRAHVRGAGQRPTLCRRLSARPKISKPCLGAVYLWRREA